MMLLIISLVGLTEKNKIEKVQDDTDRAELSWSMEVYFSKVHFCHGQWKYEQDISEIV